MNRTIFSSILFAATLASVGCSEHRMHEDYRRWTGQERQAAVDLNSASRRELERLPGITDDDADRIIANRPYPTKEALVNRGILGPRKYDKIEEYVYVSATRRYRDDDRHQDRYDYER